MHRVSKLEVAALLEMSQSSFDKSSYAKSASGAPTTKMERASKMEKGVENGKERQNGPLCKGQASLKLLFFYR